MARIDREVLHHPVIVDNRYTKWFEQGTFNRQQARDFLIQFSVFSNEFLFAQMRKMVNADSIEEMRASKELQRWQGSPGRRHRSGWFVR